jgi:cytochrome c oxidase assembly factor CtaG
VPRRRRILLGLAAALVAVSILPPLSTQANRLLVAHMSQHVVLGDVAPFVLALGFSAGWLEQPVVALLVWSASRAFWHYPTVFDAAARNPWLHQLEHACLFLGGFALFGAILHGRSVAVGLALVVYLQLAGTALGLTLLWAGAPLYDRYAQSSLGGLTDQRAAGAVMMAVGTFIALGLFVWLLLGVFREDTPPAGTLPAEPGVPPARG